MRSRDGEVVGWHPADELTARRGHGRAALIAAIAAAVVVAVSLSAIGSLRRSAADARAANSMVGSVRLELGGLNAAAWHNVALGAPDFTIQQVVRLRGATLTRRADALEQRLPRQSGQSVEIAVAVYRRGLSDALRLISRGHVPAAARVTANRVDATSQVLDAELGRDAVLLDRQAARADTRANRGTWAILTGAGLAILALLGSVLALQRRAERRRRASLKVSERRFRSLVQKASEVVVVIDDANTILYVTDSVQGLIGRPAAAVIGMSLPALAGRDERERLGAVLAAVRSGAREPGRRSEWSIEAADGRRVRVEAVASDLRADPAVGGVVLNLRDITERHRLEDQLRHQAFHDALTGLPNRALFDDRVQHALARSRRGGPGVGLLLIDVDNFKAVNDQHGHEAGDRVLREIAAALDTARRASDTAARLGGDEFAVLVEDVADTRQLLDIAARIAEALRDDSEAWTVSVGAVLATNATETTDELVRDADMAMYAAKRAGKGRVELFEGDMLDAARRALRLRHELPGVVTRGELELHYQPLTDLEQDGFTAVEALVRWRHPELGLVPPLDFIGLAEETGAILAIGSWVLRRACADLSAWRAAGTSSQLGVGVNVSALQFARPEFVAEILDVLEEFDLAPGLLTIELTESTLVEDTEVTRSQIAALRGAGVRVAVDDFGTGFSSLSYLRELQLDVVKVDRSFIDHVDERRQDATLVRSIIDLGHSLDLRIVAEGVQRPAQLAFLRSAGCDLAQGFLIARPAPEQATRRLLTQPAGEAVEEWPGRATAQRVPDTTSPVS